MAGIRVSVNRCIRGFRNLGLGFRGLGVGFWGSGVGFRV